MCVLSRLLCGSLHVKSFDWCSPRGVRCDGTGLSHGGQKDCHPLIRSAAWPSSVCRGLRLAKLHRNQWLHEPRTLTLFSQADNVHVRMDQRCLPSHHHHLEHHHSSRNRRRLLMHRHCVSAVVQEFVAGDDGCAILDVLVPPYDPYHGRPCNYYKAVSVDTSSRQQQPDPASGGSAGEEGVFRLVEVEEPEDLEVVNGEYEGPSPEGKGKGPEEEDGR